ncbi:protein of unknown function [Candidatus Nitrosotalea okcheonensis]|uniref:Uncharacterized protein n=1 Tax=Candidatus Nitrosotalea okcheonensis TaxID=1903276 RepID=A0A2H1FIW9_9ARCH|nr:protein of unknown function [Candidatus Nitrosotalea okcheonensis]
MSDSESISILSTLLAGSNFLAKSFRSTRLSLPSIFSDRSFGTAIISLMTYDFHFHFKQLYKNGIKHDYQTGRIRLRITTTIIDYNIAEFQSYRLNQKPFLVIACPPVKNAILFFTHKKGFKYTLRKSTVNPIHWIHLLNNRKTKSYSSCL